MSSTVSYTGPDVAFYENDIKAGHKSSAGTVSFIIKHFPLEGTEEAAELDLRNWAVRKAIMDKIQYIRRQGVKVKSCPFLNDCNLNDELDIAYSTQEKLLQGLINLAKAVKKCR